MGRELADKGADSICIKDMAGLITPYAAYELVAALKKDPGLPVQLHTHYTSGMGTAALIKAVEAGVDVIDTALSSMSLSTSQPPTETLVASLRGTPRDTGLDLAALAELSRVMGEIRPKYASFEAGIAAVDVNVLQFQVPGGMLSNLVSQLRQQGAMNRYYDVLDEIPKVRADMGYPPLVTPSSQIVGTQAVFNVMMGEYKVLTGEFADLMLGYYGSTIGPRDQKIVELAATQTKKERITCRPADTLKPEWEGLRSMALALKGCDGSDEDVLTYAMFPQVAPKFFSTRHQGAKNLGKAPSDAKPAATAPAGDSAKGPVQTTVAYDIKLNGKTTKVTVSPA
jgi:methylmalonyl-CoA carboxyltransferase 5S subunit